ncbi:uncharacterized protein LOC142551679 [Primulina tabacum]|uniref:uncharacterized protein LOC142551679 n=1 Tax=Primulina tabacum TaxID=48773 RepID=UPI003F5A720A
MYDPRTHDRLGRFYPNPGSDSFIGGVRESSQHNDGNHSNTCREKIVMSRPENHQESMEGDDSGVRSPPLWKNNPSPPKSPSEPLLGDHNQRSLSPNSRTQAIVRGQWELMEMVKNMPESSYELTLRDLVENPTTDQTETTSPKYERSSIILQQKGETKVTKQESYKKHEKHVTRSGGFDNKGLFLNMVFPFSFKSKKKKGFASNNSGKVSPKPEIVKGVAEKDWWKKKFTGSSDSDSSRTTINSGSSGSSGSSGGRSTRNTRTRYGFLSGCCPCFFNGKREKKP